VSALGLKDYTGRMFLSHDTSFFLVVNLRQEVAGLTSGSLIVSTRRNIDRALQVYFKHLKIAVFFQQNLTIFIRF